MKNTAYCPIHLYYHPNERVYWRRTKIGLGIALCLFAWLYVSGCAVRYRSESSCYSFEMVATEDWCEKQKEDKRP